MNNVAWIDVTIFIVYLAGMLGIGFYFLRKNESHEDYYVGGRTMSARHIGLSVVATDVGGGFSIGLGGLGFVLGLSGSWMLFTGILGAWLSAVFMIPKIYPLAKKHGFISFPEALKFHYGGRVAFLAGIISFIGYLGFTSSQVLAGAKLASATFPSFSLSDAILVMGIIAIVYTVAGGFKAVVYTDTIQWALLMSGLLFVGLPLGYVKLGGWSEIMAVMPADFLSLTNISVAQLINWMVTIVPIWFIGMTLYQRIYACKDQETAIRAWKIAGFFEWPVMAFLGVILGLFARIAWDQGLFSEWGYAVDQSLDPELGLPIFLKNILPVGLLGLMMSAYFSAIMSTADSCLMAASGNLMADVIGPYSPRHGQSMRWSQLATLLIGTAAILIALQMTEVLSLMLYSYSFMVSGLLIPVLMMLFRRKPSSVAAMYSMVGGGGLTLILILWSRPLFLGLDPICFGLTLSLFLYLTVDRMKWRDKTSSVKLS